MTRARDPAWALAGAFAVVIASFLGATSVARHMSEKVDAYASQVENVTAPSIVHLEAARTEVRTTQLLLHKLAAAHPGGDPKQVEAALARVRAERDAYLVLPVFRNEGTFWNAVDRSLGRFAAAVNRTLQLLAAGRTAEATAVLIDEVGPAAQSAVEALGQDVEFHSRNLEALADAISEVRDRALRLADILYGVALLVTFIAVVQLRRLMRASSAALEESARMAEQRARGFEAFAGRVAHDLLNPLAAAKLSVASGLRGSEPERLRGSLERASRSLGNADRIVSGLLEFARSGGKPEAGASSDLSEQVQAAVADLAARAGDAAIALEVEPLPPVKLACSAGVLASVISNLVGNAIKYMGSSEVRRIQVRAKELGGRARIEIRDTGPGLPAKLTGDDIFEMYVRGRDTHQPGLGLGLATVKRLVEGHGGRCGVDSQRGQGCTFWFELPVAAAPARSAG